MPATSSQTKTSPKKPTPQGENDASQIPELMEAILMKGAPLYITKGLKKEHMDALYTMAYNLYSEEKYKEAFPLFQSLTLNDHLDQRGWMGAAACCEMLKNYEQALAGYSYAAMLKVGDPLPPLHAFDCHMALKNYPQALSALEAVILFSSKKPEFADIKKRAELMRDALQETIKESRTS